MFAKLVSRRHRTSLACAASLLLIASGLVGSPLAQARPSTLGPCDGGGDCQTGLNPNTSGCWRDASVVHTAPLHNIDMFHDGQSYKYSIGRVELWYAPYCQTNWVKTIVDDENAKSTIKEYIYTSPDDHKNVYTEPQVDTAPSAFSLQVWAPGATPVTWDVTVYQNKTIVGTSLGGCDGTSCFD